MALHGSSSALTKEVIDEFLEASALCFRSPKSSGGCFGYAGTLLLFCIVDSFGVYLRHDIVQIDGRKEEIKKGEPFRVFNHTIFGLNLTGSQIKLVEHSYRNQLAHNASLKSGAFLIQAANKPSLSPFTFGSNAVKVVINVDSLHNLVSTGWGRFPKGRIERTCGEQQAGGTAGS